MKKLFSFCIILALVVSVMPSVTYAAVHTWGERRPSGSLSTTWEDVASDADGSNLFASNGRLYTSTNSGVNWTERQPAGNVNAVWTIDSDSDGSNLIAGNGAGRLYTSSDGGANWTERQPLGDVDSDWDSVASDADGSNLIVANLTRLYTSSDGGANWTERQPAGNTDIPWAVASDADGSNLIVGHKDGGRLYTSSDGGANWTERQPAGNVDRAWQQPASDADGSNLIVGGASFANGRLYTSSDGGANWTERQPAGDIGVGWGSFASDADGSHLVVSYYLTLAIPEASRLYSSDDGGATWDEEQPAGNVDGVWYVASDDDGDHLIAAGDQGLFIAPDTTAPTVTSFDPIDNASEVGLNALFEVTFNKNIATSTGNILLKKTSDDSTIETIDVTGPKVTISGGDTLIINPATTLSTSTGYYFLIDAGAIQDTLGNDFAGISSKTTWNFTSDAPPSIYLLTPNDDSTDVVLSPTISVEFNQEAIPGAGFITIKKASDDSTVATFDVENGAEVDFSAGEGGTVVSIVDSGTLAPSTAYYILIDSGAIEDTTGNIFTGISDETTWNFTTEAGLQIDELSPVDGATDVAIDGFTPVITFDRSVVAGTGLITLKKSSDDSTVETFDVTDGAEVDISGGIVTLSPAVTLDYETGYYFLMAAGAIEDGDGNAFAGISDETTWNFTTEVEPPPLVFEFERVSLDEAGDQVFDPNQEPAMSSDGRYVAFESGSDGVVAGDANGAADIFVYDRTLDVVEMVSMTDGGDEGDANSQKPAISEDGRYVAFRSIATNLVADDTNDVSDVFVYDRTLDVIERVSVGTSTESDGGSYDPSISADGRYVAFYSDATNLVDGDTNGTSDAFVYDRTLDVTERVSLSSEGEENIENISSVMISNDGRLALFVTSGLLTPEATDGYAHIFAYDLDTDEVELIDVTTGGIEANGDANATFAVSSDGQYVVFQSSADNLVAGDSNGIGDVFIRDKVGNTLERIGDDVEYPSGVGISGDGRYVAFVRSIDEGTGDVNALYRYDRDTEDLVFVSEGAQGGTITFSEKIPLSDDGAVLAFASNATNLVEGDSNGEVDVFIWDAAVQDFGDDEEPEPEEEEESGGSGSSHRRSSGGGSSMDALLKSLTQRIEELKSILAGLLGGSPSDDDFLFTRNLTLGDIGDDVRELQLFLITQNKGPASVALGAHGATGYFGPLTQSALAEFQTSVGITPAVGFFGPVTRAYVNAL